MGDDPVSPPPDNPFEGGRARPIATVLDSLRARIDAERFDTAVFWLEAVAADLGYGDIRPLPGAVAWLDELRKAGKKTALAASGERARAALELAGMEDRFDTVVDGPRAASTVERAIEELNGDPESTVLVDTHPSGIRAGRRAAVHMAIGVARGSAPPEELREAGADMVVADLQELLGSAHGLDR
jgi:beta-phosphoglucomutase-like phosphatase (HAD superfamily)